VKSCGILIVPHTFIWRVVSLEVEDRWGFSYERVVTWELSPLQVKRGGVLIVSHTFRWRAISLVGASHIHVESRLLGS
jgi:hypothetical protein